MANTLLQKLNVSLAERLPDFYSGLTYGSTNNRITGYVVSSAFSGCEHRERQDKLREAMEAVLTPEEFTRIGPIVTMSPAEADISVFESEPGDAKAKKRAG